jgi:hypothetical protein
MPNFIEISSKFNISARWADRNTVGECTPLNHELQRQVATSQCRVIVISKSSGRTKRQVFIKETGYPRRW